jgi:hypothetical protein
MNHQLFLTGRADRAVGLAAARRAQASGIDGSYADRPASRNMVHRSRGQEPKMLQTDFTSA